MIDSRSLEHPDWVQTATRSLKQQTVPFKEIIIVPNRDRTKTIGQCWNKGVKSATSEWVLFIGDDDYVARDMCATFLQWAELLKAKNPKAISSYMTAFDGAEMRILYRPFTGMWKRDYLLENPFDETLPRGVDREYTNKALKTNDFFAVLPHYYGYYYRQHDSKTCRRVDVHVDQHEIYMQATYGQFLLPYQERLAREGYDVYLDSHPFNPLHAEKAKVIWCDWANENAVRIADFETDARKILRVHAYEVFDPKFRFIDFEKFDRVIFVAEHIKDYAEKKVGKLPNAIVIENGVDLNEFPFVEREFNNKIAMLGQLSRKKGTDIALYLAKEVPEMEFHIAGDLMEEDLWYYIENRRNYNVYTYHKQYDVNKFFKDKSFILNTSIREGNPMSVLEGMATGLKPLVYDWVGSERLYPFNFSDTHEFRGLLDSTDPLEYRAWVEERFNFEDKYKKIKALL